MLQHHIEGVTPNIDSCGAMIAQKAMRAYKGISEAHKRWIDPEDMVQEGLVAALSVEKSYKPSGGAKFSTHMYTGLDWHFSRTYTGLTQLKRDGGVTELDAPLGNETETTGADLLADPTNGGIDGPEIINYVNSFISLCRAVSQKAIVVLVRGLLFSDTRRATPEVCAEIGAKALKLGIGMDDFRVVGQDEKVRKKLLTLVSTDVTMGMETESSLRCLECTRCEGQFSIAAIREGRFFVSSMTCWVCHREMQAAPSTISCFGKAKQNGQEGYSKADPECRLHCPDRAVCRKFVKEPNKMKFADAAVKPTVEDVDFTEVEEKAKTKAKAGKAKAGKTEKKEKKAAKPAKAAKAAKPEKVKKEKVDDDPAPKGLSKWPFKSGSVMRYLFKQLLAGADKKEIQKEIEKSGHNWPLMIGIMRREYAKKKKFTWKFDESGSRFKISDVKEHKNAA